MTQVNLRGPFIFKLVLLFSLSEMVNIGCCSNDIQDARNKAINKFEFSLSQDRIDIELLQGPTLALENETHYIFQWESTVPTAGATIFEVSVHKSPTGKIGFRSEGKRAHYGYLWLTLDLPLDKAMLTNLFDLPPTPKVTNERTKRLRDVSLTTREREDIANFIEIKRLLMDFHYQHDHRYPDDLDELNLDSLFTNDQFGNKYFYKKLVNKSNVQYPNVVLGTPGKNRKWDFDSIVIDSLFSDQREYILKTDDDIIVKFKPIRR